MRNALKTNVNVREATRWPTMLVMQMEHRNALLVLPPIIHRVTYAFLIPIALALTAPRTPLKTVSNRVRRSVWYVMPVFI